MHSFDLKIMDEQCIEPCDWCKGTGTKKHDLWFWKDVPCPLCGGKGYQLSKIGWKRAIIDLAEKYKKELENSNSSPDATNNLV